jgi:hypothetical protein
MPPKHRATSITRSMDSGSEPSSKSALFNLADPDWMTDGRKDPAKAERRKEAARKASETRKRNKLAHSALLPGSFPEDDNLRETGPAVASVENLAIQPVLPLTFTAIEGGYEGPHAVAEPPEIRRERHGPAPKPESPQRIPVEDLVEETAPTVPAEETTNPFAVREPTNPFAASRSLLRTPRGSPTASQTAPSLPTRSSHTIVDAVNRRSATSSISSRHEEEMRKMAEAIRQLQESNVQLQESNKALHEEIATVRSRRSSIAPSSRSIAPSSRAHSQPRLEMASDNKDITAEAGTEQTTGISAMPMPPPETPASRKWVEMDELQFQRDSPRKILESVLEGNRKDRLAQAGLASPSMELDPSENTAIPQKRFQQKNSEIAPQFADLTFTRGNTLKSNWTYDRWEKWPGKRAPQLNTAPIVNMIRKLPQVTGKYTLTGDVDRTIYAEIRTEEHPEYLYSATNPPGIPPGYDGSWFITEENPPRWELVGKFVGEKVHESSRPNVQRRPGPPVNEAPHEPQEPRAISVEDGSPPRQSPRSSGRRSDPRPSPQFQQFQGRRQQSGRQPRDPNDPDDPDSDDDEGHRGPPRDPPRRFPHDRERGGGQRSDHRSSSRFTDGQNPVIDQRIQKLSSKTMGTFDPDSDSVNQFCESLLTLVEMYGEMSVIAAIPAALEGRAKKWFKAHGMPRERMRSIEGWIEALTAEFKVNTAVAREKARRRKYDPSKDKSIDDYYYAKLDLVRTADANITTRTTVEELWMGLPADLQALLDYDEFVRKTVPEIGHILRTKDLSYRVMKSNKGEERRNRESGRSERRFSRREDRRWGKESRTYN